MNFDNLLRRQFPNIDYYITIPHDAFIILKPDDDDFTHIIAISKNTYEHYIGYVYNGSKRYNNTLCFTICYANYTNTCNIYETFELIPLMIHVYGKLKN